MPAVTPSAVLTPTATRSPTAAPTQHVLLVGGLCNPVVNTYPDGTAIDTIAAAVSPPGILVALWQFEGGIWLGYPPRFPEVNDLTSMDLLDVVFACVSAAGSFSRPVI